ncbi:MAG: protein phosphatase 2C domain-containing protein [Solirubrobacteraceae bacterium]|nr:protein phosphatase 2C domain-containing protein [Solirubrobacteraceae bacterium]
MTLELSSDATALGVPWAIGDPGRAAGEVPPARPGREHGHADIAITSASLPGMAVRAATVRGILHRASSTPRQDSFALGATDGGPEDALVAVVADGVGSLRRSHEAADLVTHSLARSGADGVPWGEAFVHANDALRRVLEESPPADGADGMATTAVALVLRCDAQGWAGELAWVGDSACWHLTPDGVWVALAGVKDGGDEPYQTGRVEPLPSADGSCQTASVRVAGGALFLMTDGVSDPLAWSADVQATLATWWARPPDMHTFAGQVGFARKGHMDDRTVIGIWPSGETPDDDDQQG